MAVTNRYYTDTFTGQAGQTARAESVSTELDGVQAGFDGVQADVDRSIKGPIGETALPDLPAAATRANNWLRFDASGNPIVVQAPFNWLGFWQPATVYFVGDVVQIGVNQDLVYCTTQHTSAGTYAADASNWSTFISLAGVQFLNYVVNNAAGTYAVPLRGAVFMDSSGGNQNYTLPVGTLGDSPCTLTHVGGTLAAGQAITITASGGQKIMGLSETVVNVDVANASISLSYAGSAYGWRLRTMG
jgi:hypothetical protein